MLDILGGSSQLGISHNLRAWQNAETVCKKSDFCSQLGGKAEFMTNK